MEEEDDGDEECEDNAEEEHMPSQPPGRSSIKHRAVMVVATVAGTACGLLARAARTSFGKC